MRIDADAGKGEFRHIGLGHDHRAGGAQTLHHRRIGRGRLALFGEHLGAGAGDFAGNVEQVLDTDDGAIEGPERNAGAGARIGGVRCGARRIAVNGKASARALARGVVDARKSLLKPLARRHELRPPLSTMNLAITSTPLPSRRLVNTKGRWPRIFLASRSITSSEAPT